MAAYLVSCEFAGESVRGRCLPEKLADYGEFRQLNGAMWLLTAQEDALAVRDGLAECLAPNDRLLIARLHGDVALEGYPMPLDAWVTGTLLYESADP